MLGISIELQEELIRYLRFADNELCEEFHKLKSMVFSRSLILQIIESGKEPAYPLWKVNRDIEEWLKIICFKGEALVRSGK